MQFGFYDLGYDVPIVSNPRPGSLIVGANATPYMDIPPNCIIFNLEQVSTKSNWFGTPYLELLKNNIVWDYSSKNIDALAVMGVHDVAQCGIGFSPNLQMIKQRNDKDIDVLFYGSINSHRDAILREIESTGLKVVRLFNCYGAERDEIIARSKIVLNLHYYPEQIFEIVRVSYLLTNKCFVLSEYSQDAHYGVPMCEADDVAKTCVKWIESESARNACAEFTHTRFRGVQQSMFLRYAIATTHQLLDRRSQSHSR